MPPIRIEGLTKTDKEGPRAVDHIDLGSRDGELMVLVGPSGCGTSTRLQMLAGIVEVSEGTILIGDQDVTRLDPRKRDIAMVFQSYARYPLLTARGNLGFGRRLRGTDKREIGRRVEHLAGIDAPRLRADAVRDALDAAPGDDVLLADDDRATLTAAVDPPVRPATGAASELAVEPARLHAFDAETGAAVDLNDAPATSERVQA